MIALIIAIGTGLATGLSSLKGWRLASNDASFRLLQHHDVRATLPDGGYAPQGALERAAQSADGVAAAREQLVLPTQVDASRGDDTVLVPGLLVGQRIETRPAVDGLAAERGRVLRPSDEGRNVAMLDRSFAAGRELPAAVVIRLAGGRELRSVGAAFQPQFFVAGTGGLNVGAATADFATVFTSLATAQRLTGHAGKVNQVVVRGRPGVSEAAIEQSVRRAVDVALPGVGVTFTRGSEESSYRLLYKDAEGDDKVWRILSLLVLVGAALAAYNLTSRTVEAQRREIGIGMALGVPPRRLALRPLLMGMEIAVLGAGLGMMIGLLLSRLFRSLLESQLPLPVLETPFQSRQFAAAAAVGVLLPLLGVLLPVWRAVRMRPIEAIRIGFRSAGRGGLAPLLARVRIPGSSLVQMPLRNVVRAPRRTLITVLGIGVIVSLIVTFSGLVDSFLQPIERERAEVSRGAPDRIAVSLDGFHAADGRRVRAIVASPAVREARPQNRLAVTLESGSERLDAGLTVLDPAMPGWRPSAREGAFGSGSRGILLARQAARDLGVDVGDRLVVRHPVVEGPGRVRLARSSVRVDGIHGGRLRSQAYSTAGAWDARTGLRGRANEVEVQPASGSDRDAVSRALFGQPGVASVAAVAGPLETLDEAMSKFLAYVYVTEAFVLLLALLVAFNSAAISADERRREHATMFAYGVSRRTVLAQSVAESGIVGALASIVGVLIGLVLVGWIVETIVPETFPELETSVVLTSQTLLVAVAAGVVSCALAPLLTSRRLRRMDVASTLRVTE